MKIGVDFDNTIAACDGIFVDAARKRGVRLSREAGSKRDVRDAARALPAGELLWQRLQADVYGCRMGEAALVHGFDAFVRACRARSAPVYIVSHKSRSPAADASLDLWSAARAWMEARGFFEPAGFGFAKTDVFFEETRAAKVARIANLGCTHFIDDMVEVFEDPRFPVGTRKILITGATWRDVERRIFG